MPLKIKRRRVIRETREEEVELQVPTQWGMFKPQGNRRLTQLAQKAYDAIEGLAKDGPMLGSAVRVVLLQYLVSWVKLWRTKTYGEASDTDVREQVGDFHDTLWAAAGLPGSPPWEEHYDEAQMRVYHSK